ncbi:hypothetical protein HX109_08630 [Galbibacter sp. BG1]|uniref:hypothetical protein n=1 Tax=Galbibacter sp. BG1 TaxID=1170699 RepID=UPI0015B7D60A|nr:hypothetical protein [Galbibacter sp. BG1]QLE01629.1 hypothetical protein HX109_08630 [Galbibacter sp. BG1]
MEENKMVNNVFSFLMLGFLSVVFIYLLPLHFFRGADPNLKISKLKSLSLNYLYNTNSYMGMTLITDSSDTLIHRFDLSEVEYKKMINFLKEKQLVKFIELSKILPFYVYKSEEVSLKLKKIGYQLKDVGQRDINGNVAILKMDDSHLIGGGLGVFFSYFFGAVSMIIGILILLLFILIIQLNIRSYNETGNYVGFPEWKPVDNKLYGLKFILRGFKNKEEDN